MNPVPLQGVPDTGIGDGSGGGVLSSGHLPASAPGPLFAEAARLYDQGYLSRENQLAKPTREKERYFLKAYLIPRWGSISLSQMYPQMIEEWLHATFQSWWTMHGVRGMMSRIFHYAEGHGLWEGGKGNPAAKAKLGKKRYKYERRILSMEETARVLACLEEPNLLIIETCIATGARISEILGLTWKCVNMDAATIRIEQRLWRQNLDRPKTEGSRRTLGIGRLAERYRVKAIEEAVSPGAFVFLQKRNHGKPLWDSGVRDALHLAAQQAGCDFLGLGPHSFRRANITWRQQVGGTAIEASKIAGHSDLKITGEYTFVDPARQNELTLRIQEKLAAASSPIAPTGPSPSAPARGEPAEVMKSASQKESLPQPAPVTATRKLAKLQDSVRNGSKSAAILALLQTPGGATRTEIMRLTGWRAHSVRGFISGVVMKKMGRTVESSAQNNGDRLYRLSDAS